MSVTEVAISDIEKRKELMPRAGVSQQVVEDYRASLDFLPPITLGVDNGQLVLLDGWHRLGAYEAEGKDTIPANIVDSIDPNNFFFESAKANKAHGRRLTAAEKRAVSRKLFLEENRSVTEIADATGISERHVRRLVESFNEAKKELAIEKAIKLSKKNSPATGKPHSVREIADILTDEGFDASKSSVGRWLKSARADDEELDEEDQIGQGPEEDTTLEDLEEEEEVILPKKDLQDCKQFLSRVMDMITDVEGQMKKVRGVTYSKRTLNQIYQSVNTMHKKAAELADLALDYLD